MDGSNGTTLDLAATSDLFRTLGDATRLRLLALLAEEELTVAELTEATGLSQSRVSSHLARLREAGLVRDRRDGAASFHRLAEEGMTDALRRAWTMLRETAHDAVMDEDRERLRAVLRARAGGGTWADSVAGSMDRHYSPGRTWEATAWGTLGLARLGDVLDVASGDGVLAQLLAPRARSVTCLDRSAKVTAAGRRRLRDLPNVVFRRGDMHALPFRDACFDQALCMNALTHSPRPQQVFAELRRVLRPGGSLVAVTLNRHEHAFARERYDHVQLGFSPDALRAMLDAAGLVVELCQVTSRERKQPYFEVVTIHAHRPSEEARHPT